MAASLTLAESVADALRDGILQGRFRCGERLVEITLARELNVSQNTVRDALRLLEHDGWVVKHARRGVYVRSFTREEAIEIYALLASVESVALEWAMDTLTRARVHELRRLIRAARRATSPALAIEALFRFHETIGLNSGRALTAEILSRLYNYMRLLEVTRQAQTPRNSDELEAQIRAHADLLRLMEAGDRDGAQMALLSLLAAYREMVLPVLP
ncbi:MAG: GntR family transcriptional regulator [Chloroflexota bacterium]|nr:MAG: hypothetical protein DIU68_00710 [Chloroflexota bacterium]